MNYRHSLNAILLAVSISMCTAQYGHANSTESISDQQKIDCSVAFNKGYQFKRQTFDGKSYFTEFTNEEIHHGLSYWQKQVADAYPKKKKRRKALKKNYSTSNSDGSIDGTMNNAAMIMADCNSLMTKEDAAEELTTTIQSAVKQSNKPINSNLDEIHAESLICSEYFNSVVENYSGPTSGAFGQAHTINIEQKTYWETQKSQIPASTQIRLRSEMNEVLNIAKNGSDPYMILLCAQHRNKR